MEIQIQTTKGQSRNSTGPAQGATPQDRYEELLRREPQLAVDCAFAYHS